jgi:hypothetical protein
MAKMFMGFMGFSFTDRTGFFLKAIYGIQLFLGRFNPTEAIIKER